MRFAGATNIGRKRDHNEDSISLPDSERLAIVADGMGGHASGEVASRLAVELIIDHFNETGKQQTLTWPYKVDRDLRTHVNRMVTGIMLANLEIWERSQKRGALQGDGDDLRRGVLPRRLADHRARRRQPVLPRRAAPS